MNILIKNSCINEIYTTPAWYKIYAYDNVYMQVGQVYNAETIVVYD